MVDISDHLPVVCVINIPVKKHNPIKYYRDHSNFDQESYLYVISMQSTGMLSIIMICMRQLLK